MVLVSTTPWDIDWLTPSEILEKLYKIWGGAFTLDPCSNDYNPLHVNAKEHYTKYDDGLILKWYGNVFVNPPYGRGIEKWIDKGLKEQTEDQVWLVPAKTDTDWFHKLYGNMDVICLFRRRLKFEKPDGTRHKNGTFPSCLMARTNDKVPQFIEEFKDSGIIITNYKSY